MSAEDAAKQVPTEEEKKTREELSQAVRTSSKEDHPAAQQDEAPADEVMMPLEMLNIHVPEIPGNVGLCGHMSADLTGVLAKRYKCWVYMNKEDNPQFEKKAIEDAGCQVEVVFFPGPPNLPTDEMADAVVAALDRLPRPIMLQCNTGLRAGAALLYWLSLRRGYTADSAAQLGHDCSLKFFTDCMRCGPMREWMLTRLPKTTSVGKVPEGLVFRQLFDEPTSTLTYVLGCSETKEAILIDPVLEQKDRDLALVKELGLTLKYVVNTHCHADHVTSGGVIKKDLPDVKTMISKASGAKADIHLAEGDKITWGKFSLEALSTPGHTDGCMCFLLPATGGSPAMIFTGDTLLIRGCGRTDFQQGDSGMLYDMVHSKIFDKPDDTLVYPAHDYKGRNVSTVGEEKRFNSRMTKPKEGFIKIMSELNLPYPKRIDVALPANLVCGVQDDVAST